MNCTVGFVNCFLRVPLAYQPCCPIPCCPGKRGELSENCLPNLTVQFILGRSIHFVTIMCASTYILPQVVSKFAKDDVDGVLKRANDTEFGLASGVFTNDVSKVDSCSL